MNPYQQPQVNPYNPQNTGYPPQAGSNTYSNLPPVQNPQYPQYPPQHPQYPGAGYQPPAQYGNVQPGNNKNQERKLVDAKIAELENGLSTVWVNFYQIWLWISAVIFTITFVGNLTNGPYFIVPAFLWMAWNVCQALIGMKAISEKDLTKANIACCMMCISFLSWLILEIFLIYLFSCAGSGAKNGWNDVIMFFIGLDALVICIHVGMCIGGAFKVRKLLAERGILQEKLNEIDYSFRA